MSVINEKEVVEQTPKKEQIMDAANSATNVVLLDEGHSAGIPGEKEAESINVQEETTCFTQAESINSSNSARRASSEHVISPPTSSFRRCLGRLEYHIIK